MAPVVRACQKHQVDHYILHTGQHYSYNMDQAFFVDLELPPPLHKLEAGSGPHGEQTARVLAAAERALVQDRPDILLAEGDTNSTLATALAAAKLHIPVGHVEAGLRSRDKTMPEELNRILTDHLSNYLFAPTPEARDNLLSENIPEEAVSVTGNTIVDAVLWASHRVAEKDTTLTRLGLEPRRYFLLTLHRQENADDPERLANILKGLELIHREYHLPLVFPIHPRTRKRLDEFGLCLPPCTTILDPMGYLEFLGLEGAARLVFTDSGGVQEEACILHVPCVTLRDNTERPETVRVGANALAGTAPEAVLEATRRMLSAGAEWSNPFGDGRAAERIMGIVTGDKA